MVKKGSAPGGLSLDGITMDTNSSGDAQNQSLTKNVGDFENDIGSWTLVSDSSASDPSRTGSVGGTGGSAYNGSNVVGASEDGVNSGDGGGIKRTLDLTNVDNLKVAVHPAHSNTDFSISVGGTTEYDKSPANGEDSWTDVSVDVSGYSGNNEVIIKGYNGSGSSGYNQYMIDYVRLAYPDSLSATESDGAGGVA